MLSLLEIALVGHRRPVNEARIDGLWKEEIGRIDGICRNDAQTPMREPAQTLNPAFLLICGRTAESGRGTIRLSR
ncbi:MAG TPA: hypothetical protein VFQ67_11860 [Allosphingosinicella sp.]|jgi:hypothetical protein|nr:hypothetical protein [Allosphingosinicella sp.]